MSDNTRFWLLQRRDKYDDCLGDRNPWNPPYCTTGAFVVKAADETEARRTAAANASGEGAAAWMNNTFTSCAPLEPTGEAMVIMEDYYDG